MPKTQSLEALILGHPKNDFAKNEISIYSGNPLYPQKAKSFILTYFLFQGILGLPSRSWLALYFFSLISRYSSIFKLSPWFYTKEKDLIERFFRSTRSLFSRYFIHSLAKDFCPLRIKALPCDILIIQLPVIIT